MSLNRARQSSVVYFLQLSPPDELVRDGNTIWHTKRSYLKPDEEESFPLNDLRRQIKIQWNILWVYPIYWLIQKIRGRKAEYWRKIVFIESATGKTIKTFKYIENWNAVK